MYELVVAPENKNYSQTGNIALPPSIVATFHNSSTEHATIILTDASTGNVVKAMLRKHDIPKWVNQPGDINE